MEEAKNEPDLVCVAGEVLKQGEISILFAEPGAGKSIFGVQIADAVSKGEGLFDGLLRNEIGAAKVLYIDQELTKPQFRDRYSDRASGKEYQFNANFIRAAINNDQDRLRDPGDGFYDSVNVTRDTVNADMCSIWVDDDDAGQWCGFAFCETTADAAYICCNWDCAVSNFTYPHEHGHGQGCAHNVEDAGSCPLYSYSYGHRWTQGANSYRTVMAYNTTNGPYQRIGYWSNPDVTFNGVATGPPTRDNARTLDNTARTVENFQFSQLMCGWMKIR